MKRSERLAREGLVHSFVYSANCKIIKDCYAVPNLIYCFTETVQYDGEERDIDVYENEDGLLYAVVEMW